MSQVSRMRKIAILTLLLAYVIAPFLLFGFPTETKEHCPNSEYSCPSQGLNPDANLGGWAIWMLPPLIVGGVDHWLKWRDTEQLLNAVSN